MEARASATIESPSVFNINSQ